MGVGDTPTKKNDNRFYFQYSGLSQFRADSSKQNTEPSSYFMNLAFDFIRFQNSIKFQCESHDHMKLRKPQSSLSFVTYIIYLSPLDTQILCYVCLC